MKTLLIFILCIFPQLSFGQTDDYIKSNHEALKALSEGKLKKAKKEFLKSLALQPNSPHLLKDLGVTLLMLEEYDDAEKYLEKSVQILPQDLRPHLALYDLALINKDLKKAEQRAQMMIHLFPQNYTGYALLGALHFKAKRLEESLKLYRQASRLDQKDPYLKNDLAILLTEKGQFAEAAKILDQLITEKPEKLFVKNRAEIFLRQKNENAAFKLLEKYKDLK